MHTKEVLVQTYHLVDNLYIYVCVRVRIYLCKINILNLDHSCDRSYELDY